MAKETKDTTEDAGQAEVAEKVEAINEQGFIGSEVDPTPNENYTVAGVTSGAPTPETDAAHAAKVQQEIRSR